MVEIPSRPLNYWSISSVSSTLVWNTWSKALPLTLSKLGALRIHRHLLVAHLLLSKLRILNRNQKIEIRVLSIDKNIFAKKSWKVARISTREDWSDFFFPPLLFKGIGQIFWGIGLYSCSMYGCWLVSVLLVTSCLPPPPFSPTHLCGS